MMQNINFNLTSFFTTVNDLNSLPLDSEKEVVICGRSNSGKSSVINVLTNINRLAFTSKTPGRTQHINYFLLNIANNYIVDLPGYGYAKVPEEVRNHWSKLLAEYLITRKQIVGLVLIMDIRHPLKDSDYNMIDFFAETKKPIHIILNKEDKLSKKQVKDTTELVIKTLTEANYKKFTVQTMSAMKKIGTGELKDILTKWLNEINFPILDQLPT